MKKTLKQLAFILFAFPLIFSATQNEDVPQEFIVIVNSENELDSISRKKLSKVFLKKTSRWETGDMVVPVDQKTESSTRIAFTSRIHKKKVSSIKAYWQKKIFTGRAIPPVELASDKEVIQFVSERTGAIGYISVNARISDYSVKKLTVIYK